MEAITREFTASQLLTLSELQVGLRLIAASLLGMMIGIDRERRNKHAGLRTHMLVSLAAATFCLLALELTAAAGSTQADPVRIIEAVTAGAAFLGAGTIILSRGQVKGLTTGVSLWMAGAVGLACGAGHYLIATMGVGLSLFILSAMLLVARAVKPAPETESKTAPPAT